jgi:cytochrome c biogenesis protein CcmG/thiol:disulfide interchange protein DsbE
MGGFYMKRYMNVILSIGFIWVIVAVVNTYNVEESVPAVIEEKPAINFKAPPFTLQGIDNQSYQIGSSLDKPVVLNFWASWCGPCQKEAPELERLYNLYGDKIEIYGVNMTKEDSLDGVESFLMEYQITFPILLDNTGKITDTYRIMAIPTTFFINKDGLIIDQIVGYGGPDIFKEKIEKLIANSGE